jgi:hypothetical protein
VRSSAERFPDHYFPALALSSGLWLAAAAVWALFLLPKLLRR